MKTLILACLVALTLAGEKEEINVSSENVESLSSSEGFITHIKQKLEKIKLEEQPQREDKIHPFFQPQLLQPQLLQAQPLVFSYAQSLPYTFFPQNILSLPQHPMVLPFLQPEIMEDPKAEETISPKRKIIPFPESPAVLFFEPQIQNLTGFENLGAPLPLLQALIPGIPQSLPQGPMFPTQSLLSLTQPKALPISQQMLPFTFRQRAMPFQAFPQTQQSLLDRTHEFFPGTQPVVPAYLHMV